MHYTQTKVCILNLVDAQTVVSTRCRLSGSSSAVVSSLADLDSVVEAAPGVRARILFFAIDGGRLVPFLHFVCHISKHESSLPSTLCLILLQRYTRDAVAVFEGVGSRQDLQ
ncbi:hypothetical protein DVH05_028524 [Phytophthora capsici]|nr:hypothetical protein DVH05_028524 [Phytophthora capsici]